MQVFWAALPAILVLFFATLIRSSLGFGEALVAVPLLALFMPVKQAAPTAVLVSITIALLIVLQDWRKIHFRSALRLVIPTLFGTPLGLLLITKVPESIVKAILGLVIGAFAIVSLLDRHGRELPDDRSAGIFGFVAGILGGAYGMNGPPLAIYGALRRWSPEHFRATLQAYFLPASIAGMVGYWLTGLWTPAVNHIYLISLPGVLLAVLIGRVLNRRLPIARFRTYVYVCLLVIAVILAGQSLSSALRLYRTTI